MDGKRLKITVVGDGMVGKTCLLYVYTKKTFPKEYVPTVFDNYTGTIDLDGEVREMALWDTAGQEDYERLRPLSYTQTNCFVVCYSVASRPSYENVTIKWYPELKHFATNVPIVLVEISVGLLTGQDASKPTEISVGLLTGQDASKPTATKIDLRSSQEDVITTHEGKQLKKRIRAAQFVECSALERTNVHQVFEEAVRAALKKKAVPKRACHFL